MRFVLLTIGGLAAGTGAGVQSGVIPVPEQMSQAVRALGGDPAELKNIDIKSIRATYDDVMRRVMSRQSGQAGLSLTGPRESAEPPPAPNGPPSALPRPIVNVPSGSGAVAQGSTMFDNRIGLGRGNPSH